MDTDNSSDHQLIEAPSGIELHPQPEKAVRISRRASMAIVSVVVLLLLAFANGGYRRTLNKQTAVRDAGLPRNLTPATEAGAEFMQATPAGPVPMALHAPDMPSFQRMMAPCDTDPKTGQPYRFNPQTGQPCDSVPQERVVVRQPNPIRTHAITQTPAHEETPEDRRLAAAYQREQEAIQAPTSIRNSTASSLSATTGQSTSNDLSQLEALSRALGARQGGDSVAVPSGQTPGSDYDGQNQQSRKEAFLAAARNRQADDYLRSTREAPLSRYEIKAGWEIPAVLEQSLNSDLPGELNALVTSNVYDTGTGIYLLIPQGSRLIGKYDSSIAYGQDGVQVSWSRIIYPDPFLRGSRRCDGSRFPRQRRTARPGTPPLSPPDRFLGPLMFTAAFQISQRSSQGALTYPTPTQTAGSAVGQELSQTSAQITPRNLNAEPTIKVPAGYKFTVRVNRDILFEAPHRPVQANLQPKDTLPSGAKTKD